MASNDLGPVQGLKELDRKLAELGAKTGTKVLRQAAREAMKPAFDQAKRTVPVGTEAHRTYKKRLVAPGFAQRSLRLVTQVDKDTGQVSAVIGVRKEAFYAVQFWEYGTPWMPRKPWLGKALEENATTIVSRIGGAVKKRIDKIARSRG